MFSQSTPAFRRNQLDPESTPRKLYSVNARNGGINAARPSSETSAGGAVGSGSNQNDLDRPRSGIRVLEELRGQRVPQLVSQVGRNASDSLYRATISNSDAREIPSHGGIGDCDPAGVYRVDWNDFVHTLPHIAVYIVMFSIVVWFIR